MNRREQRAASRRRSDATVALSASEAQYLGHTALRVVLFVALVATGPSTFAAGEAPTAHLTWEIDRHNIESFDARFSNHEGQAYRESNCCSAPQEELVAPKPRLILHGTVDSGFEIQSCQFSVPSQGWTMPGNVDPNSPDHCAVYTASQSVQFPVDVDTRVFLTVSDASGAQYTAGAFVRPHDVLVVGLGDSYGAGEGAAIDTQTGSFNGYDDTRCDRSRYSAETQAAFELAASDPHTSVTFIHLACSGAQIEDPDPDDREGGLLDEYEGLNPSPLGVRLLPQIEALKALLDQDGVDQDGDGKKDGDGKLDRPIDFLLISIGGNDANFAKIVKRCGLPIQPPSPYLPDCYLPGWPGEILFDWGLATLRGRFADLKDALEGELGLSWSEDDPSTAPNEGSTLRPDRIYFWEYPIAVRDENGAFCGAGGAGGGQGILDGFSAKEAQWAEEVVGPSLNGTIRQIVRGYGWNYITGTLAPFQTHGLCASDNWIIRPLDSFTLGNGSHGIFHPTRAGYRAMTDVIGPRLIYDYENPAAAPSVEFYQTDLFHVNIAGQRGWWLGSCSIFDFLLGQCREQRQPLAAYTFRFFSPRVAFRYVQLWIDGHAAQMPMVADDLTITPCITPDPSDSCEVRGPESPPNKPNQIDVVAVLRRPGHHELRAQAITERIRVIDTSQGVKLDFAPPTVQCGQPDAAWHADDISVVCSAVDDTSGLVDPADAQLTAWTHVPAGTETDNAAATVVDCDPAGGNCVSRVICDQAGNCAEEVSIAAIKIDKKAPVIEILRPAATDYAHSETLVLDYSVSDGGSGVAGITSLLDGQPTLAGHGLASGQVIDLLSELAVGEHTFQVLASDAVGNQSTSSVTFQVVATPESIQQDVTQLVAGGGITNSGISKSLLQKLGAAAAARMRGDCATAARLYRAVIAELRAQSGKKVSTDAAATVIGDAEYLIAHCP